MTFPPEFLNHEQGIAAFSNPEEGVEFLLRFNQMLSGLRKKGVGLTDYEMAALRHLLTDGSRSARLLSSGWRANTGPNHWRRLF